MCQELILILDNIEWYIQRRKFHEAKRVFENVVTFKLETILDKWDK